MILKNLNSGLLITSELKIADSFLDQLLGLLQKKNKAMLFFTNFGIHTFGMKNSIDVLILNNQNIVVKIEKNLKPNRVFFWNLKFNKVIELPAKTIAKSKLKLGDKLIILK
ncbi:MAG: DUF192 domain-containing protein [Actinobacteria bacterium]|nr:DUF192 domain-containing protein [Actinomycetota bacterium]